MYRNVMFVLAVLAFVITATALPALSEEKAKGDFVVEMKDQDCRGLLRMAGKEREFTIIFYHGFISGMKKNTLFDGPELAKSTDEIIDHCIDNPNDGLLEVFEAKRK